MSQVLNSKTENFPLATVITVNYNSGAIRDIVAASIKGIINLNYRPLEVIIVDNGSNKGSFQYIKDLVNELAPKEIMVKFLELSKNYGFAIANNIAFAERSPNSKYVALINNDLVPEPDSLKKLVNYLQENSTVGGVQGCILCWDGLKIDSAGLFLTNSWYFYPYGYGLDIRYTKESFVTYIDGAYSVYNINQLRFGGLFFPGLFMYHEDMELGVRLWRNGVKVVYLPIKAGRHYRSATAKKSSDILTYFPWRNDAALIIAYDNFYFLKILTRVVLYGSVAYALHNPLVIRGFLDGLKLGFRLKKWVKINTNIAKASQEPRINISVLKWYLYLFKCYLKHGSKATHVSYVLLSVALTRHVNKSGIKNSTLDPLKG